MLECNKEESKGEMQSERRIESVGKGNGYRRCQVREKKTAVFPIDPSPEIIILQHIDTYTFFSLNIVYLHPRVFPRKDSRSSIPVMLNTTIAFQQIFRTEIGFGKREIRNSSKADSPPHLCWRVDTISNPQGSKLPSTSSRHPHRLTITPRLPLLDGTAQENVPTCVCHGGY